MLVLGIETSCDETGIALVNVQGIDEIPCLLSQSIHSQVEVHGQYGGVVPELASRDHIRRCVPLLELVLENAGVDKSSIRLIGFTLGPGLGGALLVGAGFAKSLGLALGIPTVGVHHLEGHVLAPFFSAHRPTFPFVALLVSGGHTQLLRADDVGCYTLLGDTIDDAAGEAFDKSATLLGLGYPGGPALARLAQFGDANAYPLPRPLMHRDTLDFSFAGLKTAVRVQVSRLDSTCNQARADLAASTQEAIVDVLVAKSMAALAATGLRRLVVAGGVGANARLRERLVRACEERQSEVYFPELALCTDNGAMIALAAAMRWQRGLLPASNDYAFDVLPRWPLAAA